MPVFSNPFLYFNSSNSQFYIPPAWKRHPFQAKPPRIVHYRESSPGFSKSTTFESVFKKLHFRCRFHRFSREPMSYPQNNYFFKRKRRKVDEALKPEEKPNLCTLHIAFYTRFREQQELYFVSVARVPVYVKPWHIFLSVAGSLRETCLCVDNL